MDNMNLGCLGQAIKLVSKANKNPIIQQILTLTSDTSNLSRIVLAYESCENHQYDRKTETKIINESIKCFFDVLCLVYRLADEYKLSEEDLHELIFGMTVQQKNVLDPKLRPINPNQEQENNGK
jgi:hypothetical protein